MIKQQLRGWRHLFKLDPERDIAEEALERICLSGTDAILVGGSTGVTFDNIVELLSRIRRFPVPCVLEVSEPSAVVPGFDLYLLPIVLNTSDPEYMTGRLQRGLREYGPLLRWEEIAPEGYVILNPGCTAAEVSRANCKLDIRDVEAYARMAEHVFRLPVLYLEYSGAYGDMELVARTASLLEETRLFYGGGIDSLDKAKLAAAAAHAIVVGNALYTDLDRALETVRVK